MRCLCSRCKALVGEFLPDGDHGGVFARCPKCKAELYVSNNMLLSEEEGEEQMELDVWSDETTGADVD